MIAPFTIACPSHAELPFKNLSVHGVALHASRATYSLNGGLVRTRTANSSLRRMRVTKLHYRPIGGHGQNRTATSSMPLKHSTIKLSAHCVKRIGTYNELLIKKVRAVLTLCHATQLHVAPCGSIYWSFQNWWIRSELNRVPAKVPYRL